MYACGDESCDVRHVDHEIGTDAVRDLAELLEVDEARIGARSGKDEARLVLLRKLGDLVVVDEAGVLVHGVRHDVEVLTRNIDRTAVREVSAVRKAHAEHGVARLKQREESRKVGVRAAVSLHVGVLGAEQLFGAVDRECLDDVDVFATAVISFAGIALGILVGEMGAHCRHDCGGNDVLAGDELDVVLLSLELVFHCGAELGIFLMNGLEIDHRSLLATFSAERFRVCAAMFRAADGSLAKPCVYSVAIEAKCGIIRKNGGVHYE